MPDALLLHLNDLSDAMVATSLIKRLGKEGYTVYSVSDEWAEELFEFSGACNISVPEAKRRSYDLAINISSSFICADIINAVTAKRKLGYGVSKNQIEFYNEGAKRHYETRYLGKVTNANLFQLTFSIADLIWHGEGYGVNYFPRNRTKKFLTGLVTKDSKLKDFLMNNLSLEQSKFWQVPYKKNVLKLMDEVNRCKQIVTDDAVALHVALALRKNIQYVIPKELPYKVELFGSGDIHVYDPDVIKEFHAS